jgi:hypothetical protein
LDSPAEDLEEVDPAECADDDGLEAAAQGSYRGRLGPVPAPLQSGVAARADTGVTRPAGLVSAEQRQAVRALAKAVA